MTDERVKAANKAVAAFKAADSHMWVAYSVACWALNELDVLLLADNAISGAGMGAFASPILKRALASLRVLNLSSNSFGDIGVTTLAGASRALASLKELILAENSISDIGMQALAGAVSGGALAQLTTLDLHWNRIGDVGLSSLAAVVGNRALDHLTVCWRPAALSPRLETWQVHSPD